MCELAYRQLVDSLSGIDTPATESVDPTDLYVAAFFNAWGIVDSANRLRRLLDSFPGLKKTAEFQVLIRRLRPVEALRNPIQHLDSEFVKAGEDFELVWGSLSWCRVRGVDPFEATLYLLAPGMSDRDVTERPLVNPLGRHVPPGVSQVQLTAYGTTLNLDAIRAIAAELAETFRLDKESRASSTPAIDLLASVDLR